MTTPPTIDLHEDVSAYYFYHGAGLPLGDFAEDLPGREADIPKYQRANVRLVFAAIFPGIESFSLEESRVLQDLYGRWLPATKYRAPQSIVWEHLSIYYKMSERYKIRLVESYSDVEKCVFGGELCFLLHLEGAEAIEDPYDLVLWRRLGLRSVGLTWNYVNKYATGCAAKKDLGLSSEGEALVETASRLRLIIDLAHASKNTMIDVLNIVRRPVIISHANVRRIVDNPRNVDDEVLELLYRNRGVIGLSAISPLISRKPRASIDDLVEHFVYIRESYGVDMIAVGTDFLGLLGIPAPEGFESIDKIPALYQRLLERGFGEDDIEKIAYKNVLRILRENLE
ncbi:MAG: dipeptidase [Sulfolobales archaeon]